MNRAIQYLKQAIKESLRIFSRQYQQAIQDEDHFKLIITRAKIDAYRDMEARIDFCEREYGENQD